MLKEENDLGILKFVLFAEGPPVSELKRRTAETIIELALFTLLCLLFFDGFSKNAVLEDLLMLLAFRKLLDAAFTGKETLPEIVLLFISFELLLCDMELMSLPNLLFWLGFVVVCDESVALVALDIVSSASLEAVISLDATPVSVTV